MRVILTNDVVGVGDIGEEVRVKPGYARNFLIPRGLAIESGSADAREIEHRMRQIEAKKKRLKAGAEEQAANLSQMSVVLELRVGTGGKVFGSVGTRDIAEKLKQQGFEIDRRRVLLGDPIKKIGTQKVRVKLHPEVTVEVPVTVNAVAATKEQEEEETEGARQAIEEKAVSQEEASETSEDSAEEEVVEKTEEAEAEAEQSEEEEVEAEQSEEVEVEEEEET